MINTVRVTDILRGIFSISWLRTETRVLTLAVNLEFLNARLAGMFACRRTVVFSLLCLATLDSLPALG